MKYYLSLPLFFFFSTLSALSPHHLAKSEQHAQKWVREHVVSGHTPDERHISLHDLYHLANLFYISWKRSEVTVQALPVSLEALDLVGHGWQNIAQTRRNPSLNTPYTINKNTRSRVLQKFWELVDEHRAIGQAYANITEAIVKDDLLESKKLQQEIGALRLEVRNFVLEAMLDVKQQLDLLNNLLENRGVSTRSHTTRGVRDMIDFVLDKLPGLTYYSFVQTDRMNKKVSEESWRALMLLQQTGNTVWEALETTRAEFYRVHYEVLMNALEAYGVPCPAITIEQWENN